jgi:hypothetical protein
VLAVERADGVRVHQLHRQVAVLDPGRGQRREGRPAELLRSVDEVQLDQGC